MFIRRFTLFWKSILAAQFGKMVFKLQCPKKTTKIKPYKNLVSEIAQCQESPSLELKR